MRVVAYEPRHAEGFRELVLATLDEFGFQEDAELDADLADPAASYDAVWVLADDSAVAGSVAMRLDADRCAELKRMYLEPARRGRGHGRELLDTALAWARERGVRRVRLDTADAMTAAQRLYEAAGFRRSGERIERGACESRCELLYELDLASAS